MENVSQDNSFPADDRAKCKDWLKKLSGPVTFAHCPLFRSFSTNKMPIQIFPGGGHRCNCKHRKCSENQMPIKSNFLKGAAKN